MLGFSGHFTEKTMAVDRFPYFRKTIPELRKRGNDEVIATAMMFHASELKGCIKKNMIFESREEECDSLMSKLFFEKIEMYPGEKFVSKMDENYAWPVGIIPSELFDDLESTAFLRKRIFCKNLKKGDTIVVRVNSVTPVSYVSLVVHKYGCRRIFHDLNIQVTMNRAETNTFLQKELSKGDCCAVVVSGIEEGEKFKICASLNNIDDTCPGRKLRNLGRISDEEVASYHLNLPEHNFASYSDYLNSVPAFNNHLIINKLCTDLGVDIHKIHSFYPQFAKLSFDEEYTGTAVLKKLITRDITKYLGEALAKRQEGNFKKALELVNLAIELDNQFIRSYEIRGIIYKDMSFPKDSLEAYFDWCQIIERDSKNACAEEEISKLLSKAANRLYKSKKYAIAAKVAQKALEYKNDNKSAASLIDYLKIKYPEAFLDSDESTLQAVKEGLVAQLKVLSTSSVP